MSIFPYSFLVAFLYHHQTCLVQSDINIELVLLQENINKITLFLDPCVIQGHVPA
jgi:hypothetical protein